MIAMVEIYPWLLIRNLVKIYILTIHRISYPMRDLLPNQTKLQLKQDMSHQLEYLKIIAQDGKNVNWQSDKECEDYHFNWSHTYSRHLQSLANELYSYSAKNDQMGSQMFILIHQFFLLQLVRMSQMENDEGKEIFESMAQSFCSSAVDFISIVQQHNIDPSRVRVTELSGGMGGYCFDVFADSEVHTQMNQLSLEQCLRDCLKE